MSNGLDKAKEAVEHFFEVAKEKVVEIEKEVVGFFKGGEAEATQVADEAKAEVTVAEDATKAEIKDLTGASDAPATTETTTNIEAAAPEATAPATTDVPVAEAAPAQVAVVEDKPAQ